MSTQSEVTGGILAGGRNARAGSNKAFLILQGKTFIEHVGDALSAVCSSVLVSANDASAFSFLPYRIVQDIHPGKGPLGGLHALLHDCPTEFLLVSACDTPLINPGLLLALLDCRVPRGAAIAESEGQHHPLCGIYHKSLAPVAESLLGGKNYAIHALLDRCSVNTLRVTPDLPFYHPLLLRNLNTPADFRSLELL